MKTRNGFVSNSSSSSFAVVNLSGKPKTIVDFVEENWLLVEKFNRQYDKEESPEAVLVSAKRLLEKDPFIYTINPGEQRTWIFGDEDGTPIGRVYDYALRSGGRSTSFAWEQNGSLR